MVFATHNPNKVLEIQKMLPGGIELLSLDDIGCSEPIPETETTLEGNARLKAKYVRERYGYDCFADDTGLEVAALGGAPGVFSARYAGPRADAVANMRKLLAEMAGCDDRRARFRTAIALSLDGEYHFFEGEVTGEILWEPKGDQGFGYDPIFMPAGSGRSFAEFPLADKNRISHRGKAFRALESFLKGRV
nr:non-canonical purine NTP diphosphatase [Robiginitalea sp. SC105]